uniref:RING-CH-type domain-containing protein n=1 Tax=Physcomitrium patens TaxID=3218 RepID=A0A7I4FVY9_PHYPA
MLRRFNSLIKGPKALSSDEESTENLSLRPARSVDSSLFASKQRVAMASPLQQPVRRSEDGQTSLSVSVLIGSSQHEREERGRAFVIGQVPEDRSWKEGYEQGENSPATPQEQYEPGEKPSDFHCVDLSGSANDVNDSHDATMQTVGQSGENASAIQPQFTFLPVSTQLGNDQSQTELPRISRTSSDAVVAVDSNSQPNYHSTVDVSDVQHGSAVELENLLKGVLTFGPGRTISSWSTDSAAEYCRICQQHTEEPLIDLGCSCRGEMAKSHKSCIEVWFKNKGTNKCEVCQHVASNIPAPATAPVPHFWVWRLGGTNAAGQSQTSNGGIRRVFWWC